MPSTALTEVRPEAALKKHAAVVETTLNKNPEAPYSSAPYSSAYQLSLEELPPSFELLEGKIVHHYRLEPVNDAPVPPIDVIFTAP